MSKSDLSALSAAIAAQLRGHMARLDIAGTDMLLLSGVDRNALPSWGAGRRAPSLSAIMRMCDVLGVPVSQILREAEASL